MTQTKRWLIESYAAATSDGPALKIDRALGVIYGVKVLGRFSKNRYVAKSEGTEYSPEAMRGALHLYEGAQVNVDHPSKRQPAEDRSSNDAFGVIRAVRFENDGVFGDLHYLTKHSLAECVCEDVEKRMGVYGLSHNAFAGKEKFDKSTNRLVIESISSVQSVDLVRHAATNRNLWESQMSTPNTTPTTMRAIIESQMKRFSAPRKKVLTRLLEDDSMSDIVSASADEPDAGDTPESAMWSGFQAAITATLEKYKNGEMEIADVLKKIKTLLKAHADITAKDEPDDEPEEPETPAESKTESVNPELLMLRKEKVVRTLCESLNYVPTKSTMTALMAMDKDSERRALIAEIKPANGIADKTRQTRSGTHLSESANGAGNGERNLTESANILRNFD